MMRKLLALAAGGALLMTGCAESSQPEAQDKPITVMADPQAECLPKGVPGNCWLPLSTVPELGGVALNSSAKCNNNSRDQRSCWPQPWTELTAECIRNGADGRPWYGFKMDPARITNKVAVAGEPSNKDIYGYAAATHLNVKHGFSVGDLAACK